MNRLIVIAVIALLIVPVLAVAESKLPSEVIGHWRMSEGSGSSFQDPNTGQFSSPNLNIYEYKILEDGSYQHAALLTSSQYNCTMQIFGFESGVVSLKEDKIVFEDREAKLASKDNCNPEFNYEKPGKLSRTEYGWRKDRDEYGEVLILRWANGKEDRFYRMQPEKQE